MLVPKPMTAERERTGAVIAVDGGTTANNQRVFGRKEDVGRSLRTHADDVATSSWAGAETDQPDVVFVNQIGIASAGTVHVHQLANKDCANGLKGIGVKESDLKHLAVLSSAGSRGRIRCGFGDDLTAIGSDRYPEQILGRIQQEMLIQTRID